MSYKSNINKIRLDKKADDFLELTGQLIEGAAILLSPVNKQGGGGNLRQGMSHEVRSTKKEVIIGNSMEYARFVEQGTGIHAKDGKGRKTPWVYFNERTGQFVKTSGSKAQPFLKPAAFSNIAKIIAIGKQVFKL